MQIKEARGAYERSAAFRRGRRTASPLGAIRENTVEFGIKESLSERGIEAQVDTR